MRKNKCKACRTEKQCLKQGNCRINLSTHQRKRRQHVYTLVGRWKMRKGCVLCGYIGKHPASLHLDHIDPSKKKHKGSAFHPTWSTKRLKEELSKCQVLCANCHFERTFIEQHISTKKAEDT